MQHPLGDRQMGLPGTTPPPWSGPNPGPFPITCVSCPWRESPGSLSSLLLISSRSFCRQFLAWEGRAGQETLALDTERQHTISPTFVPVPNLYSCESVLSWALAGGRKDLVKWGCSPVPTTQAIKLTYFLPLEELTFELGGQHKRQISKTCNMLYGNKCLGKTWARVRVRKS